MLSTKPFTQWVGTPPGGVAPVATFEDGIISLAGRLTFQTGVPAMTVIGWMPVGYRLPGKSGMLTVTSEGVRVVLMDEDGTVTLIQPMPAGSWVDLSFITPFPESAPGQPEEPTEPQPAPPPPVKATPAPSKNTKA